MCDVGGWLNATRFGQFTAHGTKSARGRSIQTIYAFSLVGAGWTYEFRLEIWNGSRFGEHLPLNWQYGGVWSTRFLSQLAAAHTARHELPTAIELGTQALKAAREGNDKYSEAVAAANLGLVFRLTGNTRLAVEHLSTALGIAEALGYSNLLSVALGHYPYPYPYP